MQRTPLREAERALASCLTRLRVSRYLQGLSDETLAQVLRQGELLELAAGEQLIRNGADEEPVIYLLVDGSLAVSVTGRFILRLQHPGELVGEMAVLTSAPRSADVTTEVSSRVVAFAPTAFQVNPGAAQVPVFYHLCAHILAEKLRLTTAQSLLRKDARADPGAAPRIALVDAHGDDRAVLCRLLATHWPQAVVVEMADPQAFVSRPPRDRFDLLIADPDLPQAGARGAIAPADLIDAVLQFSAPVMVISRSCQQPGSIARLEALGVAEALPKPLRADDCLRSIGHLRRQLETRRELDELEHAADTDALTGLASRRRLDEYLDALLLTAARDSRPFGLILFDVDHFKQCNDQHGHAAGDAALVAVAAACRQSIRHGDLAGRYGGDEFVVALPGCDRSAAATVAEKLRSAVTRANLYDGLTITLGVAAYPSDGDHLAALLQVADQRLYQGKSAGRNQVVAVDQAV